MHDDGSRAFEARNEEKSRIYSYERATAAFNPQQEKQFRANKKAWKFFNEQPPGYRRLAMHYVVSAKQEETRARRLATLIDESAHQRRLGLTRVTRETP